MPTLSKAFYLFNNKKSFIIKKPITGVIKPMIIISSRKSFNDPDTLKAHGHKYKEIDFSTDLAIRELQEEELLNQISGKRVLLLIHGYNNEQDEVYDAYTVINDKISEHTHNKYDCVIGYTWPGGDKGIEWYASKSRANSVARRFRFLISALSQQADILDIMSHSLGARVVFKALKQAKDDTVIRNYFCMAAAVDNEVLEQNEEFHLSISKAKNVFIFHSKNDEVLSIAYKVAEWDNALGLYGPEDKSYIQKQAKNIYVINCKKVIASHGDYKRTKEIYKYINRVLTKRTAKFVTL